MAEPISTKASINEAARAGVILGAICIIYSFLVAATGRLSGSTGVTLIVTGIHLILWVVKFVGCIWAMSFLMKKLVRDYDDVTNSGTFRFGVQTALFSAIIVAAYGLVDAVLSPEKYQETIDTVIGAYSSALDSNTMATLEKFMTNMEVYIFFAQLIYCFLFGLILSAILSRNIPARNPFAAHGNAGASPSMDPDASGHSVSDEDTEEKEE